MSKIRVALAFVLLALAGTSALAGGSVKTNWYSDSSFSVIVGERYIPADDCPPGDVYWESGYMTSYRKFLVYPECDQAGTPTITCQAFLNNSWTTVLCP